MGAAEFDFQFQSAVPDRTGRMKAQAEKRMKDLANKNNDMIGASVVVEELANHTSTYAFRARVVAFVRPENIAGEGKANSPQLALKDALDNTVRQVREQREKLRKRWKQPGATPPGDISAGLGG